ncbi:hypothetical protein TNCV_5069521 [Trichonephila clavipes]|nr:hypothetical protein TNCV_5069521 [Trichonephila clavipes]
MTYHNCLEDFLRWRAIGRLEAVQSQAEVARWVRLPSMESIPNKWYCHQEGRPWSTQNRSWTLSARRHRWTMVPQLARELAAVSERRISWQKVCSLYVRHPAWCVILTASSRKERIL